MDQTYPDTIGMFKMKCEVYVSKISFISFRIVKYSSVSNTRPVLNKSPGGKIGQKQ